VGRLQAFRLVVGLSLAVAVGTSAVVSGGFWMALAPAHAACCPEPSADEGPVLHGTCCDPAPVLPAPGVATASIPGPDLQATTPTVPSPGADARAAYRAALPLAARGHASTPTSALLI
jgi:hypothetical protein